MRIFLTSLILLFSFSFAFAQYKSDVEVNKSYDNRPSIATFGVMGYGYIPLGVDKDLIGNGGGGGFKATINFNRYFALGLSTALSGGSSNYGNTSNLTLLSDTRVLFILQRETLRNQSGFVPWIGLGFGVIASAGNYGTLKTEDMVGFNISAMAGVRYNFRRAYVGIGAEYMFAALTGDLVSNDNYYYYYQRRQTVNMDASGVNIFGEIGFRF